MEFLEAVWGVISEISPSFPIPTVWDGALGRLEFGGRLEGGYRGLEETYPDL